MVVLATCLMAAAAASRHRQPDPHLRAWTVLALAFGALTLLRLGGIEELLRDFFRAELRLEGAYAERRTYQRWFALATMTAVGALFTWGLIRQWGAVRGRRNMALFAAWASIAMMILLLGLRIVSLHQIDVLLYGPVKLNWIIDIGASLTVLAAAAVYIRLVTQRP